jgi:hypothetical protein
LSPLVEPHISLYRITEWEREQVVCSSDISDFCTFEVSGLNVSGTPTGIKLGQDLSNVLFTAIQLFDAA